VQPNRQPIAFILFFGSLLGLSVFAFTYLPSKTWLQSKGIYFYSLEYPSTKTPTETGPEDISVESSAPLDSVEKGIPAVKFSKSPTPLALKKPKRIQLPDSVLAVYDSLSASLKYLSFSPESDLLESFFVRLNNAGKQSVRIWYYCNSQVEGDRITREVRR